MALKFDSELKDLGIEGEEKAIKILKDMGFILSRPDYSGYRNIEDFFFNEWIKINEDIDFEIKAKAEPFNPPPFYGHGADIYQIKKRLKKYEKYGIKQFLLIIQKNGEIYGQWLHKLEQGKKFNTNNGIRIYPIENFIKIGIRK